MKLVTFSLFALFLSCEVSAQAATLRPQEDGVWTGTLGKQEVMACFEHYRGNDSNRPPYGAYFYRRYGKLIEFTPPLDPKRNWIEKGDQGSTGTWSFNIRGNDWLNGVWSAPNADATAVLRLKRVKKLDDYFSGCHGESFLFNLEVDRHLSFKTHTFPNGNWYRSRSTSVGKNVATARSFYLDGDGEGIASLNERLANELRSDLVDYFSCPVRSTGEVVKSATSGEQPDLSSDISVLFKSARWISLIKTTSGDCGGAYPFSSWSRSTWDLTTGEPENLWAWVKGGATPPKLNKLIADRAVKSRLAFNPKEAKEEPNCLETLRDNKDYQVSIGAKGLVFSHNFPHVSQACNDSIEIEYNLLRPFLSPHGMKQVGLIINSAPK